MKENIKNKSTNLDLEKTLSSLFQENKELKAILEVLQAIPLAKTFEASAHMIFNICKKLTKATCGYVALLSKDGSENELLFLDDGGLPCTVDHSLPMPIRGLRAFAYKHGQVAYDNDFSNSEWLQFMPHGHVKLHNVLFAPLNFGKKTVGVIGLANKSEGFSNHDIKLADTFGEIAALALQHSRVREKLIERDKFSNNLLMKSPNPIVVLNPDKTIQYANQAFEALTGFSVDEILNKKPPYPWWTKDTLQKTQADFNHAMNKGANKVEEKFQNKNGRCFYVEITSIPVFYNGQLSYYLANWVDITDKKAREKEILEKQKALEENTNKLKEMNTALKVLIDHHRQELDNFQNDIIRKFERVVIPYFPASPEIQSREQLSTTIMIIENHVKEILYKNSTFNKVEHPDLSPTESRVAFMIRSGKSSKEIASSLNMSLRTVYFHRENIRKKLNLSKLKTNLRTYLQSSYL